MLLWCLTETEGVLKVKGLLGLTVKNGCANVEGEASFIMASLLCKLVPGAVFYGAEDYLTLWASLCQDTRYNITPSWGHHNIWYKNKRSIIKEG